jgi:macrolide-specific efflux system membrane fusion protein
MLSFVRNLLSPSALRRSLALAVAVLAVMAASGCNFLPPEEEQLAPPLIVPEEIKYRTITVELSTIINLFRGGGSVISARQESVSFTELSGRLDSIKVKLGDKVKQGDLIATLDVGDIEDQIVTAELNHRKVEIGYQQTLDRYNARQITALDLEKAAIDLQLSDISLDRLKTQLETSRIYAPFAGQVVYMATLQHNDRVDTYQPIVTIADLSDLLIRYSRENYINLVPGTEVVVNVARVPYDAVVIASGTNAPTGATGSQLNAALIKTRIPLPDSTILGSTAYFEYELARSEKTVVIPKRLLSTVGGRQFVNILVDGIRVERDIKPGIENDTDIEILNGLKAGDLLIDR